MIHWCFRQTLVLCLALVISVSAFGQNRANFPWWNSPVVEDLNLTQAQKQKIHQIVRAYRDRLFDARNAHQKAVANLEDILNEPEVNMEAAKPVIDRVTAARANASKVFLEMSTELRGVLTLDQWRQLVRRWDEAQRKRKNDTQVPPE
ncbi:MAG: Spy/CpxP family protein refolding chaperone [Bryobacteraceae bacterium]